MLEQEQPELLDPQAVKVILVVDEECTPCQQIHRHLEQYGGQYEVIDPLSAEAERFWGEDKVEFPTAMIQRENGEEVPCEIFMDEDNMVLKCEGKVLVVKEPSPGLLGSLPAELPLEPSSELLESLPAELPLEP